jgi:O-antigen/teichoic acid export membrane protein
MLRAVLAYGVPLVPISLSSWAIGMSNRFFIRGHSGITDVGLFSSGNKVAQIMFLAVTAFALAWGPFAFSIAEEPDAKRTYAKVLTFYVAVLGWLALALSLFAPLILALGRPAYMRGYQVVPPLTLSYLIAGAYYIVAVGTSLSRKTIHLSWTTAAGGIVALLANVLLLPVPYFALIGGALATLFGNMVWVALVYWVSQRLYPIPYELKRVLTCICILVTLVLLGQIARGYVQPTSPLGLLVRLALTGLYPFLLVFAGVIERYEVKVLHGAVWSRIRQRLITSRL